MSPRLAKSCLLVEIRAAPPCPLPLGYFTSAPRALELRANPYCTKLGGGKLGEVGHTTGLGFLYIEAPPVESGILGQLEGWLFPLGKLLLNLWLVVHAYVKGGPNLQIAFQEA